MHHHTTFLTPDAFLARYRFTTKGQPFVYATGDLAQACQHERDAFALREVVQSYEQQKKVVLTQRPRPNLTMKIGGGRAFDYIATKRVED